MMKRVRGMLAAALVVACASAAASAASAATDERRLALVVGNGAYQVQPLDNPVNDAALMAETLSDVGFEVTHLEDLDQRAFERAIVTFSRDLRAAGEDAVGLFFYAGHAIQADGENYLIPVDAELQDALDLRIQTIDASTLMTSLDAAGNRLNMVFLDACRNNPFKGLSRSGARGLAKLDAPTGTLIAYSTAPGDVAVDGAGRNSPYTRALARAIREPGLPVEQAMKQVRIDVMERTGARQTPWESSSLTGDFFFTQAAPAPEPEPQQVAAAPASDAAADQAVEIEFWKAVAAANAEAGYRDYLARYPEGLFAGLAQDRLSQMAAAQSAAEQKAAREAEITFFQTIQASESVEGYETYLTQYPDGLFAGLARQRIQALETIETAARSAPAAPPASVDDETMLWSAVKDGTTKAEFQSYLDAYPQGKHAAVAKARIAAIEERRQVAALQPAGGAYDGQWTLRLESRRGASSFYAVKGELWCARGEEGETEVRVREGAFEAKLSSQRYNRAKVEGTFIDDAQVEVDVTAVAGATSISDGRGDVVLKRNDQGVFEGRAILQTHQGDNCEFVVELRRAD